MIFQTKKSKKHKRSVNYYFQKEKKSFFLSIPSPIFLIVRIAVFPKHRNFNQGWGLFPLEKDGTGDSWGGRVDGIR